MLQLHSLMPKELRAATELEKGDGYMVRVPYTGSDYE